jgi:hypothetical protein
MLYVFSKTAADGYDDGLGGGGKECSKYKNHS